MCGIIGSVGVSKNQEATFVLLTHLLRETERRGPHSTGHYLVNNEDSSHQYFKTPIPACIYTRMREWKKIQEINPKALMAHARYKTKGGEYNNANNHPHVSPRENLALVHNGTLGLFEKHKTGYHINGDSDSELLLKIIIRENNIIDGIHQIYEKFGSTGSFACEVIYRNPNDGNTRFFFFRDRGRPGRFIDARKSLGQYFFCSVSPIWKDAVKSAEKSMPEIKELKLNDLPIQIIPSYEIWEIDAQTLKINKIFLDIPKQEEVKEEKSSSDKKSKWIKTKSLNGRTNYYVEKYEKPNSYFYKNGTYKKKGESLTDPNLGSSENSKFCHDSNEKDFPKHGNIRLDDSGKLVNII